MPNQKHHLTVKNITKSSSQQFIRLIKILFIEKSIIGQENILQMCGLI
jgi:hypothetical protein